MLELTNELVLQTPVDFDFAHQLLLGSALRQRRLLHNFAGVDVLRLVTHELITLGEPSLAQEFAFSVSSNLDGAIGVLDLLLDYCGGCLLAIHSLQVLNSILLYSNQN